MKIVNVALGAKSADLDRSYHILIKRGLIEEIGPRLSDIGVSNALFL